MRRIVVGTLALAALVVAFALWTRPPPEPSPPELTLEPGTGGGQFERAVEPVDIRLPEDHGPHPEYQTEWWYYTGNLATREGRRFGYQLTFFRRGLTPDPPAREASFATHQIYFAHFALADMEAGTHREWERFSRGAAGLAGAEMDPLRVWLEDWSAEGRNPEGSEVALKATAEGIGIELALEATKPLVRHGEGGLSPKSDERGNASYYVSYTRMATSGTLSALGEVYEVEGESWFDHEWSTSALGPEAVGWEWFSLQLTDGREMMYFQIRNGDGTVDPVSSGTLIAPDGSTKGLTWTEVKLEVLETWSSPRSAATYPVRWRLRVPSASLDLTVEARLRDQEMNVSFTYWEGAVTIQGESGGSPLEGQGYVELTGYAESMQGRF